MVDLNPPTIQVTVPDVDTVALTPSDDLDPTRPWLLYDFTFHVSGARGGKLVLADVEAEWVEVVSLVDGLRSLHGCVVEDDDPNPGTLIRDVLLERDDLALFVRTPWSDANGRLQRDGPLGVMLGNGGDVVRLTCDGVVVDEVQYDEQLGFPFAWASSMSLEPAAFGAAANDQGLNWCPGPPVYSGDPMFQSANWGSPGLDNPPCEVDLGWCNLQHPQEVWGQAALPFTVYGRVYVAGLTDRTHAVDDHRRLVAAGGVGPPGAAPNSADWSWFLATPNTTWDAAAMGAVNNDEYQADVFCPQEAGEYDFAFRLSDDGGETWTYCDIDGSHNGFSSAQTGDLTVQ